MSKNVNTTIHGLTHDGRGIATIEQKTTFISGALPQETVHCCITQRKSQYQEAALSEVIEPSQERATPPCEHFGICGGCNLQHMQMELQLKFKQQTLLDQLRHFGQVTPTNMLLPLSAAHLGYRRKARLGVRYVYKKNKLLIGFREKSSRYLADLHRCHTLHPRIGNHLEELRELVSGLTIYEHIPQIEFAMGDKDVALVFRHMVDITDHDQQSLIEYGKKNNISIYLQPNPPKLIHRLWPTDTPERLSYTLPDFNLEFLFHPLDFTQINLEMNRLMVQQAIDLLAVQPEDTVLDLFCGIGNFTLPLARRAAKVIGIEGSQEMVERGYANSIHNSLKNVEFYAANLQADDPRDDWLNISYDRILLDPPRTGAKEIVPKIATLGAKQIVYVSCNPATLARDAGELVNKYGYELTHAGIMNMFPHTAHIEAMAVFKKN